MTTVSEFMFLCKGLPARRTAARLAREAVLDFNEHYDLNSDDTTIAEGLPPLVDSRCRIRFVLKCLSVVRRVK
jgi:hypothetical protein